MKKIIFVERITMPKLDFNTVGITCNSLNALEGKYRFLEPNQGTSSILHNAQELIWLLWAALEESKGAPMPPNK